MVPAHRDVASVEEPFLKNLLSPEFVPPVDQGDATRDIGKVERFFHRGVPAADDGDVLTLVEESVAGRAGGDALSHEFLLGFEPEIAGGGAGGDDQRIAGVFTRVALQAKGPLLAPYGVTMIEHDLGLETLG